MTATLGADCPTAVLDNLPRAARRGAVALGVAAVPGDVATSDLPLVEVTSDAVVVRHLRCTDAGVVAGVHDADDPVEHLQRCLGMGARILRLAHTSIDTVAVRDELDGVTERFTGAVTQAVAQFATLSEQLVDAETGTLAKRDADLVSTLRQLLGTTFDPARTDSAIAAIENVLAKAGDANLSQFRALVNPDVPDSVLGRFRNEISRVLTEQLSAVRGEMRELTERVATSTAAKAAAAHVHAGGTAKGFEYEQQVLRLLEGCALAYGDLAAATGNETGAAGSKKGDVVIALSPDDTGGESASVVVEVKDRKLSMIKTMAELDAAMANRCASVGLAVFASQDAAPTSLPFVWFDSKAVLVLDKDDPDPSALRLAYAWARWAARRQLTPETDALDAARIGALLETGRRGLTRRVTIRRAHATMRTKLEEATGEVDALVDELAGVLDALERALSERASSDAPPGLAS